MSDVSGIRCEIIGKKDLNVIYPLKTCWLRQATAHTGVECVAICVFGAEDLSRMSQSHLIMTIFLFGTTVPSWPGPPHSRGL
jgi:hypothetical protein